MVPRHWPQFGLINYFLAIMVITAALTSLVGCTNNFSAKSNRLTGSDKEALLHGEASTVPISAALRNRLPAGNDVVVDYGSDAGPVTRRATGVIHGISASSPPDSLLMPLKINAFRTDINRAVNSSARVSALDEFSRLSSPTLGPMPFAGAWILLNVLDPGPATGAGQIGKITSPTLSAAVSVSIECNLIFGTSPIMVNSGNEAGINGCRPG